MDQFDMTQLAVATNTAHGRKRLGSKNRASLGADVLRTHFTHRGPKVNRDSGYRQAHNKNRMDSPNRLNEDEQSISALHH